jgi:uncharacterized membrane protein required for colicin V production
VNLVDLLLAAIVLIGAWTGWRRGFVRASLFLAALLASLAIAVLTWRLPAHWLARMLPELGATWAAPIVFLLAFMLAQLLLDGFAQGLAQRLPRRAHAHAANRVLGIAPGLANGALQAALIALLLLNVTVWRPLAAQARDSSVALALVPPAAQLDARLRPVFGPALERIAQVLRSAPGRMEEARLAGGQ